MHELSSSFILAYHGCDRSVAERLLNNKTFRLSENDYDWLGSGAYFWEANPARALAWARHLKKVDKTIVSWSGGVTRLPPLKLVRRFPF